MRAAAIVSPGVSDEQVRRFELASIELQVASEVPPYADAALVFGGDGSVHRHLAGLVAADVPLLVVPVGSGNDFAHALGLPTPQHALAAWQRFCRRRDNLRSIDLGVITPGAQAPYKDDHHRTAEAVPLRNSDTAEGAPLRNLDTAAAVPLATTPNAERETGHVLFCCIGGAGLDAETNRRANAMPAWLRARGGYVVAAMAAIARWRPAEMRVQLDGRELSGPATLVAFANAPTYGGGMRMAPRAQLDDGKLDLCFVRRAGKVRLLTFFPGVFFGAHLRLPEVEYVQAERVRIATDPPLDVYADGEFICRTPIEVTIQPRALTVIAPV
jgi:diacylglycerol kinase (ATP)